MNWADFHFLRPLWLLVSIPALGLLFSLLRRHQQTGSWSAVCDADLLPFILEQKLTRQSRWPLVSGSIISILTILALAGPTWERLPSPVFRNASALVIALNLSTSMDAGDIKPSRLIRARYKIADLLKQRKDGQTALLVYAGDAFTVTPLTNDKETIDNQLSALNTDIMPSQGNNTVSALQKATYLLKQAGLHQGRILLVTDAVDADNALSTVEKLGDYGLSILAVGTPEGAPIKAAQGDFVKDANGAIIIPKLNTTELAKLTEAGHGILVNLTDDNADIESLSHFFEKTVQQPGVENETLVLQQWADQGPWLLLLVLPLAAMFFRKGLFCFALLACLPLPKNSYALEWSDLWLTKDQQAQQAFQQKDYKTAAEKFNNPEWLAAAHYKAGNYQQALDNLKNAQSADDFYNRGNALTQSGQLAEALKAYEQALKLKPDDADAKYNKELVEKELKKQEQENQQDQQKRKDQQEQQDSQQQKSGQEADKSGQEQQGKPSEQNSEQKQSEQADPSEQSPEQQAAGQEQKPEEKKPEPESAEPAKQEQAKDSKNSERPESAAATEQQTESALANEQWLKRIPDDPSGLLKRKFRYQYGQRQH